MKEFYTNFCILLTFLGIIMADFNDFVITNENDLQRFDLEDEGDYDDDEYYAEYYNDMIQNVDDCGGAYDFTNNILKTDGNDNSEEALSKILKNGEIDVEIIRQVMKQLQNDPWYSAYMKQAQDDSDVYTDMNGCQARIGMDED